MTEPMIRQVEAGPMQNFSYLIGCPETKMSALVDTGWEPDRLLALVESNGFQLDKILLTHRHYDHVAAVRAICEKKQITICLSEKLGADSYSQLDLTGLAVLPLHEASEFKIGMLRVRVLSTPGHTPDSICFLVEEKHLFTGDTLFQGTYGRCDLEGSSPTALQQSLQRLAALNPDIIVYPGHDYGSTKTTTIGIERETNPTIRK